MWFQGHINLFTKKSELELLSCKLGQKLAKKNNHERLKPKQLTDVTFYAYVQQMASDVIGYAGLFPVTLSNIPFKQSDPKFGNVLRNALTFLTSRDASVLSMTSYLLNPEVSALNIDVHMCGTMTSVSEIEEHLHAILGHLLKECDVIRHFEGVMGLCINFPLSFDRGAIEGVLSSNIHCKLGWQFKHLFQNRLNSRPC